jgi:hypothetical protein
MVDYNIGIPQQQLFQSPDVMQNAMRMQQMQTQGAQVESANQLRAMQTRGLEQDQRLTALKMQATRQDMATAAAARAQAAAAQAEALRDKNALERAIRESVVSDFGPRPGPDLSVAANRLAAENRFGPAAAALGMVNAFTESDKKKVDLSKSTADLDKINIDNLDKEVEVFKTMAPSVRTPDDAAMFVGAMAVHPRISKLILQMGTREELMDKARRDFANDPERWVTANVNLTGQQVVDTLKQKQEATDLGGQISTQTMDAFGRRVGAPVVQAKTPTPKETSQELTPVQEQKMRTDIGEARANAGESMATLQETLRAAKDVLALPEETKNAISGYTGKYTPNLSAEAKDAQTKFNDVVGQITAMSKASAGSIGSMAVQEWKILADQVASLDLTNMNAKTLDRQMKIIINRAEGLMNRTRSNYTNIYGPLMEKYKGQFDLPAAIPPIADNIDPRAIEKLRSDPSMAKAFDEHFGRPGAAAAILGK